MKNNKGFIAISLIYSFFLVFLMTLLAIISDYAHNRILLNNVKSVTQEKLNSLSEFNPLFLEKKDYAPGSEISYAGDKWIVIQDNNENSMVTLVLKRNLTNVEISKSFENFEESKKSIYMNAVDDKNVTMCLNLKENIYDTIFCNYKNGVSTIMDLYTWDSSIAKNIVDNWLFNNALLQKAMDKEALNKMSFEDGTGKTYESNIRIPIKGEYDDNNIWTLTYEKEENLNSYVYINGSGKIAHETNAEIHPVIQVLKK